MKELSPKRKVFQSEGPHKFTRNNTKRVRAVSVRWLSADVKEGQIRERFQIHGKIRRIVVASSYVSPRQGVEAIVTYSNWKDAETAVNSEASLLTIFEGFLDH